MIDPIGLATAGMGVARQVVGGVLDATGPDGVFAQLLGMKSGVRATPAKLADGVELELTEDQLRAIGAAADKARAAGVEHALVRIDGMLLEINSESRTVLGKVSLEKGEMLTGIGALIEINGEKPVAPSADAILRSLASRV